jgi:hypothetical protein
MFFGTTEARLPAEIMTLLSGRNISWETALAATSILQRFIIIKTATRLMAFQLPIWITEFQCYGTDAQQISFLQTVLPWLDSTSYVSRYAYFGVFQDYLVNSAGTGLSDIGTAYATT